MKNLIKDVQRQMGIKANGVLCKKTEYMIKELQLVCDAEITGKIDKETYLLICGEDINKTEEPYIILN